MQETSNTASEFNSGITSTYSYTYVSSIFTRENGNYYPTPQNTDWNLLLKWMDKIGNYSKPPSLDESIDSSLYIFIFNAKSFKYLFYRVIIFYCVINFFVRTINFS